MKMLSLKFNSTFLILLCTVLLFASCKKDEHAEKTQQQQSRLVFKDVQELFRTLDQVEKMSDEQLKQWEKDHQHNSFRTYLSTWSENYAPPSKQEQSLLDLPTSYQVLLNKDGELQVGDSVVWYNQGTKYFVAANDLALLQKIKSDPSLARSKGTYSVSSLAKLGGPHTETTNLPLNGLDARYQYEFIQQSTTQGTGGCRKYVHEIVGVVDNWANFGDPFCGNFYSFYVRLLLRIKMEWKNCSRSNYQPAGERRTVSYNVTKNIQLRGVVPPCSNFETNIPFTGTQSSAPFVTTSNIDVVLGGYAGNSRFSNIYWEVNLSGTIRQHVEGSPSPGTNDWVHQGNPFF